MMKSKDKWFTSDSHFWHRNIIDYCNRPFYYVQDMNRVMIENWNKVVKSFDTVYHLGDFCFGSRNYTRETLEKLNGNIILIRGNHDKGIKTLTEMGFTNVTDKLTTIKIGNRDVNLCHFPYFNEHDSERDIKYKDRRPKDDGKWLFCGHIHEKWKVCNQMVNVGVDVWNFTPVHEDILIKLMDEYDRFYETMDKQTHQR